MAANITFTYDLSTFRKKIQDHVKEFSEVCKEILLEGVNSLANNLAKYTPPDIGSNSIRRDRYYRPIIPLKELCSKDGYNGRHATGDDYRAYRNKMKFKIVNTKTMTKKTWTVKYAKTMGEAKKIAYIKARGISRVMWALHLPDIGGRLSAHVLRTIKGLQVSRPELNKIWWENEDKVCIENKVDGLDRIRGWSSRTAEEIAEKRMNILIKSKIGGKTVNV